ncbi:hypothetical protein GCM10020254_53590 [Streptomyces goshikiensis]
MRLQARVPRDPGGGQRLGVVGAGVVEAARVVCQPAHRYGQFARAGVQPVLGGLPGGPGVEQRVGGAQGFGGPPVQRVGPVPVVQQPDLAYGVLDRRGLGLAGAGGDAAAVAEQGEAQRGGGHGRGAARHERATQHVALLGGEGVRCASRPRTASRGEKPRSARVRPGNMWRKTRS